MSIGFNKRHYQKLKYILFKEQDYETKGIQMKIGGTHKLTGGMNYAVIAKIPRDKLNKNAIGVSMNIFFCCNVKYNFVVT